MNCCKRFLSMVLLTVLIVSLLSGCQKDADAFDPHTVPVFSTASVDLKAKSDQIAEKLDQSDYCSFGIDDMGAITYRRLDSSDDQPMELTDEEALQQAKEYLKKAGLLPEDAYHTDVRRVSRTAIDLNGGEAAQPETTSIEVRFYRVFNGVDVISDQEDGILLSFDAQGIRSLQYLWRKIDSSEIAEKTDPISSEDAHQIYLDQWDTRHGTCCEPTENPEIFNAYIQLNGVSRPCWVIAEDRAYTNAWFIDMFTGEVLF